MWTGKWNVWCFNSIISILNIAAISEESFNKMRKENLLYHCRFEWVHLFLLYFFLIKWCTSQLISNWQNYLKWNKKKNICNEMMAKLNWSRCEDNFIRPGIPGKDGGNSNPEWRCQVPGRLKRCCNLQCLYHWYHCCQPIPMGNRKYAK